MNVQRTNPNPPTSETSVVSVSSVISVLFRKSCRTTGAPGFEKKHRRTLRRFNNSITPGPNTPAISMFSIETSKTFGHFNFSTKIFTEPAFGVRALARCAFSNPKATTLGKSTNDLPPQPDSEPSAAVGYDKEVVRWVKRLLGPEITIGNELLDDSSKTHPE
jgi:hypothetical protein